MFNSHDTRKGNAWKFVKTLHVKFFPFGSVEPVGSVTVKYQMFLFFKVYIPNFSPESPVIFA